MKLFDTHYQGNGVYQFDGGMDDLSLPGVTKSFQRAKRLALARLRADLKETLEEIHDLEQMTEETCPTIPNPFR